MQDRLIIFDTTLRDGEQSPGASMTSGEKMRIARQLERMRVDVIEAGFPAASPGDFEAVQLIAKQVKESTICALARANEKDVGLAADAIAPARLGRIHTFIATSSIHMQDKLRMTPEQVLDRAVAAVAQARNSTDDVEFSPEDAGRSDFDFLCRILEAAIHAGANTIKRSCMTVLLPYRVPKNYASSKVNPSRPALVTTTSPGAGHSSPWGLK